MGKRTKPQADDTSLLSQRNSFIETARELGCDESEEVAERIFTRLVPPRRPGDPLPQKPEPTPPTAGRGRPRKKG